MDGDKEINNNQIKEDGDNKEAIIKVDGDSQAIKVAGDSKEAIIKADGGSQAIKVVGVNQTVGDKMINQNKSINSYIYL